MGLPLRGPKSRKLSFHFFIFSACFLGCFSITKNHFTLKKNSFLDAFSHLYKRVCPSVGPSVRRSVRRSVGHTRVEIPQKCCFRPKLLAVVLVKNGTFAWFQLVCDRRTDGRTDGPTDGPTDGRTDGRTHPLIEMRERI